MKILFTNGNKTKKFQQGGEVAPEAGGAPVGAPEGGAPQGGGEDPMMQIAQMALQALQTQDCNAAMQVCQVFVQLLQQAQGGGAPEEAPAEEMGEPVYRRGGTLVKRIKK
jgi:hypothetical protein